MTLTLRIVTPEKQFINEPVDMVVLPGLDGEIGVLHGHALMATVVTNGRLRYQIGDKWRFVHIGEGFAEITPTQAMIFVQTAEYPENIDRVRAKQSLEQAQERMRQAASMREYTLSKAMLSRAMARLQTSGRDDINHQ